MSPPTSFVKSFPVTPDQNSQYQCPGQQRAGQTFSFHPACRYVCAGRNMTAWTENSISCLSTTAFALACEEGDLMDMQSMKQFSDSELWVEIKAGNPGAWTILVNRYKSLVYSVSTYMGLSQTDSADCFQQTWSQLYQYRDRLEDPSRVSSWLVTTARREAMALQRTGRRFVSYEPSAEINDPLPLPDKVLEELECQAQLEEALRQIDQPCQKLLHLFFFADDEFSYEQIAADMGLAANTLGAKRRRCLEKLRQILSALGYSHERNTR